MNIEKKLEIALINNDIKTLKKIEKKILDSKNLELSIKFCKESYVVDIKKHQKMIIDSKNIHANYEFAKLIPNINIKEHEKIILDYKMPIYSYKFALNVEGADIEKHARVVIDSKSLEYNYEFAKNIKGADVNAHGKVILDSKDENYCYMYARDIKGIDIKEYEKIVIESETLLTNYKFAKYVEGANIEKIGNLILEKNEEYFDQNFLPNVPTANIIFAEYIKAHEKSNQTLAIIKPDGMAHIESIIEMFYKNGLKITNFKVASLDEEILSEHYSHLVDKPFYPKLKNYMMSEPVALIKLEGENAVEILRDLMGPTDSTKAEKDTIRGMFGTDITYNAIHGSDSKENAEIEIERFFKEKVKTK